MAENFVLQVPLYNANESFDRKLANMP